MNQVTDGYSLAFVPWDYWEKHIDWMAMNGINRPLNMVGQEAIWAETFEAFNVSLDQQASFLVGPAYLPWWRMGGLRGFAGPLSANWLQQRKALALKILARERELGMQPALGCFTGHVPAAFAARFPAANITRGPPWNGHFPNNLTRGFVVEPTDPLFAAVGQKFIELQTAAFGTDHIYQCDLYNELTPPTNDPKYLAAAAAAVYEAMSGGIGGDPDAIWLQQAWLFAFGPTQSFWQPPQVEAYLGGVARRRFAGTIGTPVCFANFSSSLQFSLTWYLELMKGIATAAFPTPSAIES